MAAGGWDSRDSARASSATYRRKPSARRRAMDRVSRFFGNLPGLGNAPPPPDAPVVDTAEKVQISSLALLKMLKHGARGFFRGG